MSDQGPVDVEIKFGNSSETVRLGGYLRDQAAAVASVVTDRSAASLPPTVDLRENCTEVEDQKRLASCAANVVVGAMEYHRKKARIDPSDLSRLFVYYNARRMRGNESRDSGCAMEDAMAAVLAFGAPRADLWPYDDRERWNVEPSREAFQNAKLNETLQYARIDPGVGVLATVAQGFPVCVGCFLPKMAYDVAGQTGAMPELTEAAWQQAGGPMGHAMLIVGYDLIRSQYLVRNSWGRRWGDGGYATVPFSVIDRGAPAESFWTLGNLEQEGGLALSKPDDRSKAETMRESVREDLAGGLDGFRAGLRDRLTRR